jgi:hypothetical protein
MTLNVRPVGDEELALEDLQQALDAPKERT